MTVYSISYKVGLIYAGTNFTQSWLVRSEIAKSAHWISSWGFACKTLGFVAYVNIAPHQSAQVIIQCGTRYVDFSIFMAFRSLWSVRHFPIFDSTFDLIPDSASQNAKAWYRQSFHSKPHPGVFHSSVLLGRQILRRAPLLYRLLHFCNQQTQFNKNTYSNALSVWFFLLL